MANSVIEQKPLYTRLPIGQDIIFVVSNNTAVANELKVKFIAKVYISDTNPTATNLIGTFKATPNGAAVGMFNFRDILENYVKPDSMAYQGSSYKGTTTTVTRKNYLHTIDKYSLNTNSVRYFQIRFSVEYLGGYDGVNPADDNVVAEQVGTTAPVQTYTMFNGYLKYTDHLSLNGLDFGFDISAGTGTVFFPSTPFSRYLTNAPTTQYANLEDYGTLAFLAPYDALANTVNKIDFEYFDSTGASIGTDSVSKSSVTGAYATWNSDVSRALVYIGCFPANLRNWSTTFQALVTAGTIQGGSYTISAKTAGGASSLEVVTINLNCPTAKNYESIRLCWLNQWGAWDYYTFTKKSIRTLTTQGSTYHQLGGTWNESAYYLDTYKGGKKAFRVNTTEKIRINTDFVTENDTVMFEELINSPEVYLLDGYQTDLSKPALNQYVTPVRLLTSNFTKKTIANDKLMQYTFEIEKSRTLRTQSV
jgi:hypothetical protein